MDTKIPTAKHYIKSNWNILKTHNISFVREELKGKCLDYDEKKLQKWFNSKKYREKQTRSKGTTQSMATASVAGDLGTLDDFEQPKPKIPVPLTLQALLQFPSSKSSSFKKFNPTLLNGLPFVGTPIEQTPMSKIFVG